VREYELYLAECAAERARYDAVTDPRVLAVLDVLAPRWPDPAGDRVPEIEEATALDMIAMAERIVRAVTDAS
jgi:hypothetical protein